MACKQAHLRWRQRPADREHLAHAIAAPLARAPRLQLGGDISGRLTGERRIGGVPTFARSAVASSAPLTVKLRSVCKRRAGGRKGRIVRRNLGTIRPTEAPDDRAHFKMLPAAVGIVVHLAMEVPCIEPRQPGRQAAVAFAFQTVTRRAGMARPSVAAAKGDYLAGCTEGGVATLRAATAQGNGDQQGECGKETTHR